MVLTFRALALRQREGTMLKTLDYTIRIGSTPTILYFDEYCTKNIDDKILTTRAPPSWIEFDVVTSQRQTRHLQYGL